MGLINTVGGDVSGLQLGFVNTAANGYGAQISFINTAKKINGVQLGFINYAESVEKGFPLGFISIVRNGGYKAVELSVNEIAPLNAAFKIGIDKLYTSINVSYNPMKAGFSDALFTGFGLGSNIPIKELFFFNPELIMTTAIIKWNNYYVSLAPNFGVRIISGLSVLVGPSIAWEYIGGDHDSAKPFFSILNHPINDDNRLLIWGRISLRYQW
jgi:hypothetical protein